MVVELERKRVVALVLIETGIADSEDNLEGGAVARFENLVVEAALLGGSVGHSVGYERVPQNRDEGRSEKAYV
jgi:hypothetical protein